jgi:cobalt-zinc-cadmium resistance protein CzcA
MNNLVKIIISFSLRHKLFIFFMTGILAIAGIYCFIKTPIVAFPDFTNTQIQIITRWPGRSAQEVERFVTIPVETCVERGAEKNKSSFTIPVWSFGCNTCI